MRTKFNRGMWGTAVLAVAFVVAACGDGGNPSAGGEVVDGELALPVTATYGYLDITVNSLEETDEDPVEGTTTDPETYVAVEVSVANPTDEASFELPPDMFVLEGGGDPVRGTTVDGAWLRVEPQSTTTETLWFVLPETAALESPRLVVNESGYQPLSIPLAGATAAPEEVPVTMEGTFEAECELVEFGDGVASYNVQVTEDGATRPGPGVSNLGRATEGEVLVTFDITATERCTGAVTFFFLRHQISTLIQQVWVGDLAIATEDNIGQVDDRSATGYLAAAVPADATDPLVIEYLSTTDYETSGTTSAPLEAIAELTGS